MRFHSVALRVVAVAAIVAITSTLSQSQVSDYGPAKVAYDDYIKRPSLQMRTRGRVKLAQTGDLRAMKILADNYPKPEDPKDQVKYLLASIMAQYLNGEEHLATWKELRDKNIKPEDAWLWYRGLIVANGYLGDDELIATAKDTKKNLFLRAAALEAMAEQNSEQCLPLMIELLPALLDTKAGIDRIVLTETFARMWYARAHELGTDNFRNFGLKFIPMIDEKHTHDRTKLVMARYFREIFSTQQLYINAAPWLDKLLNPQKAEDPSNSKYRAVPPPTKFVGLEASGKRIAYVIDLSDSMMKPVSVKEKEEIKKPPPPRGPTTPGRGEKGNPGGPQKPEEKEPEKEKDMADDLPWDKIKVRFHVAREYLKLSLKSLRPDQEFCVIGFGTEAKFFNSTKGLVPASAQNVQAAIRELDNIRPGPPTDIRKDGTLWGDTNLHGGVHRAFKAKRGGPIKEFEYVDAGTFTDGADTVFILSDGDPTDDDWAIQDKRDPQDQTGDPETRTKMPDQEVLRFPGPYGYWLGAGQGQFIVDDVRRMNLFRKCEINIVGIGEVSYSMLQGIARQALGGQVKMISGN
ncbi:MAG: hypothetical protein KF754_12370 [Planctomycetes bacterium]|nr:hypothetical protein [Planctomycetota bacterium]